MSIAEVADAAQGIGGVPHGQDGVQEAEEAWHELGGDSAAAAGHAEQDEQRDRDPGKEPTEEGRQAVGGQRHGLGQQEQVQQAFFAAPT
jgi:hypothetical protein